METRWGQEITVFEQNKSISELSRVGDPVVVHWNHEHTFGLDGGEDINAGVQHSVLELEGAE